VGWLYAVVRGGRPAVESVPFDVVVNFSAGSGALTATHLNNGTHGADWGTWRAYHNGTPDAANDHTTIEDHAVTLPFKVSVGGSEYDGSEGQGLTFDHTELPTEYDAYQISPASKTGVLALFLASFDVELGGTPVSYNNDTLIIAGSNYTVPQFQLVFNGAKRWTCHSEGELGAEIPYSSGWVIVCVHHDAAGGRGQLYVQDATTLAVLGASATIHDPAAGSLVYIRLTDYLRGANQGAGSIKIKLLAMRSSDLTFPPYAITVPAPTAVSAEQTATNTITLTWTSLCQVFTIERNKNSAGWVTLDATFDNNGVDEYVDTDLANGNTAQYRVSAVIGGQSSAVVSSNTVTVSN
jgi:hypothetical protein